MNVFVRCFYDFFVESVIETIVSWLFKNVFNMYVMSRLYP